MSIAKKGLAIAGLAEDKDTSEVVKVLTLVRGQTAGTAGFKDALAYGPEKARVFTTLKVAEKVVSAAGLGRVDKRKHALAALTVGAGVNVFACVATGCAFCVLGAASFASEAMDAHARCRPPPG